MSLYDQLKNEKNPSAVFPKLLDRLTIGQNHLTHCTLELTPLCNFRCKFCYARVSQEELVQRNICVMRYDEWIRYIDELADMNCLTLNFTGGECTLHPDFVEIYRHAYRRGFSVNVFTNGSYMTEDIVETFRQMPPARIYLTVYGSTPETYETVVGRGDYCETVMNNVRLLAGLKLDVIVQGTFTGDNLHDMEALYDFAASLGLEYRYTTQLQLYGHCTPEIIEENRRLDKLAKQYSRNIWKKKHGESEEAEPTVRHIVPVPTDPNAVGIKCNAGKNSVFIRHDGKMLICNTLDANSVDTHGRSVRECFAELNAWASGLKRITECEGCIHAHHCTTCIAAHYNDTGVLGVPSPRFCFKVREPEKAAEERAFFDAHGYLEV